MPQSFSFDNDEIELQKDGKLVHMFSTSEFESEFGQTVEEYNQKQLQEKTSFKAIAHNWKTTVTSY